ncbi:MAG TPA: hypothetical protein VMC83_26385 [Streptosporangiaceae bacterium]|nr:hypothetical protein [Streptosporangiaceae bacterium]
MTEHTTLTAARPGALRPAPPLAVRIAAWVMYAGAAASAARGVAYLTTERATKAALEHRFPRLSGGNITTLAHATVTTGSLAGLIGVAAFIWIALACMAGKNWARITGTVFCALGILGAFIGLDAGRSPATVIIGFVVTGIGLVSVCMLWLRSSNAFFGNARHPGS